MNLYNKYRPKTLSDVVGQEVVVSIVTDDLKTKNFPSAYLFTGKRGVGKTTVAKIFAKAVNCDNPIEETGEACHVCNACKNFNSSYSFIEYNSSRDTSIDYIRALKEQLLNGALNSKRICVVFDEAHGLSNSAMNALLDMVEMENNNVLYFLLTTEDNIIDTLKSRCRKVAFKDISIDVIGQTLKNICIAEKIEYEESAINLISAKADHSLRDGISLMDTVISYSQKESTIVSLDNTTAVLGIVDTKSLFNFHNSFFKGDEQERIALFYELLKYNYSVFNVFESYLNFLRDMRFIYLMKTPEYEKMRITSEPFFNHVYEHKETFKNVFHYEIIDKMFNHFIPLMSDVKKSSDPVLLAEMRLLQFKK